jgi:hypothetical protein
MRRWAIVILICSAFLALGVGVALGAQSAPAGKAAVLDTVNGNSSGTDPANGRGLTDGDPCGHGPNDNRPQPCTEIAEAPVMLLYPLAALIVVGGFFFVVRRRRARAESSPLVTQPRN